VRERTLGNIARLRRVEQKIADPEIAAVREDLESQLDGTVSRSTAARHLGVSHTALNKWVTSGDVPVVVTKEGRKEVPIPALLELQERVAVQRRPSKPRSHALERVVMERRQRAGRLSRRVEPPGSSNREGSHRVADLRSLAYHRAVAARLRRPMVDEVERKLGRWEEEGKVDPRHAQAWREVFALPMERLRRVITADDGIGRELRQSSPLAGLLTEPERRRILGLT
jgi:hypothetical protein